MSDFTSRQKSDCATALLSDLTMIVRPTGKPAEVRAFTDAERAEAELYASETGSIVEPLS